MKNGYETYEIQILNEEGYIIHRHLYEGFMDEAMDNAERSSKHWIGGPYTWRIIKIK